MSNLHGMKRPSMAGVNNPSFKHGHSNGHGKSGSPEYRSWAKMRRRCRDTKDNRYPRYGGRGITVCERWENFELFLADMGPKPTQKHTIHRKDNDLNYEPGNCCWADIKTQERNRSNNRLLTVSGETKCLSEWAEGIGADMKTLWQRLHRGWSPERTVSTPIRRWPV
jgi:hypothetical protein